MKIICTTSDRYLHILPIFCFLWNKYWGVSVEIVGYKKPEFELPSNFTFVSLGEQKGDVKNFTRDLRKHFAKQDQFFIWTMEDTFLTNYVDHRSFVTLKALAEPNSIGRINLCHEVTKQDHIKFGVVNGYQVYENTKTSKYRLSTQMSIWNRDFVLEYMKDDLTPWEFECQSDHAVDHYRILGLNNIDSPIRKNEGVRKNDLYKYNLDNIPQDVILEMKEKGYIPSIKLHLGCGKRDFGSEWIHIDKANYPHIKSKDVTKLPYDDNSVDMIYCSHLIAYFDRVEILAVLKEWKRVLRSGGILRIATPDFHNMVKLYLTSAIELADILGPIYGRMPANDEMIYHKTVYDFSSLMTVLKGTGFMSVNRYDWKETGHAKFDDHSQAYLHPKGDKENGVLISLNVQCIKP